MKKFLLTAAIILGAYAVCPAQSVFTAAKVEISKDKVRKGNHTYYAHFVEEYQTLYSIAKAYGVSTKDIMDANRDLRLEENPIHPGNILLIPIADELSSQSVTEQTRDASSLLSLFKKKDKPREEPQKDTPVTEPAVQHPDSLIVDFTDPFEEIRDSVVVETTELDMLALDFDSEIPSVINVTLLLPLNSLDTPSERYLNFYMGALLAARKLGMDGLEIDLETLDTTDPSTAAEASFRLQDSDVIIGPVSSSEIKDILPFVPEDKFLVSPMDAKTQGLTQDNNVILAATTTTSQIKDMAEWVKSDLPQTDTLLVVSEYDKYSGTIKLIKDNLDLDNTPNSLRISYEISKGLEMDEWFMEHTHLKDSLTRVVVASDNDAFLKEVIRAVNVQNYKGKNVELYGPAKIRTAEMEDLCNARLHVSTSYYIDYKDPAVQQFILDYRALYNTDPDSFAFHGYDTMLYFTGACARYGRRWADRLPEYRMEGLQTSFVFEESDTPGNVNRGIRRVIYSPGFKAEIQR